MNFLVQALIYIFLAVAGTVLSSLQQQDQRTQKRPAPGVRGTLQSGGDLSPEFIIGRYGTGGQLRYAGTWGNDGETPNAFYSKVIEVSCLPVRGYSGWFVFGERVTLDATKTGDLGYAVLEYRRDGKDYLWINPYIGDQTTQDPLMVSKFASDPDRPYEDFIGRGVGYFVATARLNRELFPQMPEYMAEVDGIALDDPRGDGQHDNPIVACYTLLKGLTYGGEWIYGPQGITDVNFRAANLEEEADKCDLIIDGRKQFRVGMVVSLDEEPHSVVGEILKGCAGRWADLGGVYRFLVGAPGEPVVAITDGDIVITEQQTLDPFPGLESLFNGMTATYPEPDEAWQMKEAPPRYRSDLEVLDDGRRLPFATQYRAVPWAEQVQHLMRLTIEETRRFRKHTQTMSPAFWEYEPLDVLAWTSARNGYVAKSFLITAQEDLPNAHQFIGLQEVDPNDYGWSSEFELPWDTAPLVIARPAPQQILGFAVEPYVGRDNDGVARRPGFRVYGYGSGLDDVQAVWVQARLAGEDGLKIDGYAPYDPDQPAPSVQWSGDPLVRVTDYDVRAKLVPFSGRATTWSEWLPVTTPDIKLGALDVIYGDIDLDELGDQTEGYFDWMGGSVRELYEKAQEQDVHGADQELANAAQFDEMRRSLAVVTSDLLASFNETITVAIVPMQGQLVAIADQLTELEAEVGDVASSVTVRGTAQASPGGGWARWGVEVKTGSGNDWSSGAFFIDTNGSSSRAVVAVDQFVVTSSSVVSTPFIFDGSAIRVANAFIANLTASNITAGSITGDRLAAGTVTADKINVANLFAQNAAISGVLTVGSNISIDGPNGRIVVSD